MIEERYELACERIGQIKKENKLEEPYLTYFHTTAIFLEHIESVYQNIKSRNWQDITLKALQQENRNLYEELLIENYDTSYANPFYMAQKAEKEMAPLLCFLYTELKSLISFAYEQKKFDVVIRLELFLEIYGAFCDSFEELQKPPSYKEIQQILYWFVNDYSELETEIRIAQQLDCENQFAVTIIQNAELEDLRYLFQFGEYITENEMQTARFLNSLPQKTIDKMADTFTEGYRMGFVNGKKDLSKKKTVNIRYSLGFERVVKKAIENFANMGLKPTIYRAGNSIFNKKANLKIGYFGAIVNKQYEYDHKEDEALFLDKKLMNRRIEVLRDTYEKNKTLAEVHAGPACMEVFGEAPFVPINKEENCKLTKEQQKLSVEYVSKQGQIVNEYIKGEERSFTIIAFPTPEIGEQFEEIFEEIIKINTLDYMLYQTIQQTLIDTLDKASRVCILGKGENETDLTIELLELTNPNIQTLFENCVADVNIPVGEVFTTPKLQGTNGCLHVSSVYLGELEYKNLKVFFENGKTKTYSCENFQTTEENQQYIKENILFHHESLPLGEFAIGTNTTAYVVCKKYGLEKKLPILIAEKMGPHFALGDTCYSHSEEIAVQNPDGKEIIARDNEMSSLRKEDIQKAYFNCHTDITIPYDEIAELFAETLQGEKIEIIRDGRFVLEGTEKLNEPFFNY